MFQSQEAQEKKFSGDTNAHPQIAQVFSAPPQPVQLK